MAELPDWQELLEAGMQFTELRREQARKLVADLVERGQIARDQANSAVDEVVSLSRERSEALAELIRAEVQRQVRTLGIATQEDLERLERKLTAAPAKKAAKAPAAKKAPAKKAAAAKKAPAKKAVAAAPAPSAATEASNA